MMLTISHLLAVATPLTYGARLGTAQDETFAVILGTFMTLSLLMMFWLRSGHERARRSVLVRRERDREETRERAQILEAHSLPARAGEELPR